MKEIVVLSGKGGAGKTSTTAALAGLGPDKVLVDCDVDAADLHLVLAPEIQETRDFLSGEIAAIDPERCTECGLCAESCRYDAISDDFRVIREQCEGCGVCHFVCPAEAVDMSIRHCGHVYRSETRFGPMVHAALGVGEENSGKLVTDVRNSARDLAESLGIDLILSDGSPGIGCPVIASLSNADLVLLTAEPTLSAVGDAKRVLDLVDHFRIPAVALLNKSDINPELGDDFVDYCGGRKVPLIGRLPYDQTFTMAQIEGKTAHEYDPDGIGALFPSIWERLLERLGG